MSGKNKKQPDHTADVLEEEKDEKRKGVTREPGYYSNEVIRRRNGGVRHQFEDSIGGYSGNYR